MRIFIFAFLCVTTLGCEHTTRPKSATQGSREVIPSRHDEPELQLAWIRAQMGQADESHSIIQNHGSLSSKNSEQNLLIQFENSGVHLRAQQNSSDWSSKLRISRFGRTNSLNFLSDAQPTKINTHRVQYSHLASLDEWYVTGSLGLEMGATLYNRPQGEGKIELELNTDGLEPHIINDEVHLADASGQYYLRIHSLFAEDANKKLLPSTMFVREGHIVIAIDDSNAQYPILIDPLIDTFVSKLQASDGATNDKFGTSVAIDGDYALIGAPQRTATGEVKAGSVYVFIRTENEDGISWDFESLIEPDDSEADAQFGNAVALSGNFALIGASYDDASASDSGSAYVFMRSEIDGISTWSQEYKLEASDGASDDRFGESVSIDEDRALIGAPYVDTSGGDNAGSAYVFIRSEDGTWNQENKIEPDTDDAFIDANFGMSVSLQEDRALIGASYDSTITDTYHGSAYIFTRSETDGISNWEQEYKIVPSDAEDEALFGFAVALDGERALIGAPQHDVDAINNVGLAYIYERAVAGDISWELKATLEPNPTEPETIGANDYFGRNVALEGDIAIVSAYADDTTDGTSTFSSAGSVYVFTLEDDSWAQGNYIESPETTPTTNLFGYGIAIDDHTLLVGAQSATGAAASSGAAYIFSFQFSNGDVCSSSTECISGICVDGVCCDSACGDSATDDCFACSVSEGASEDGVCATVESEMCSDEMDAGITDDAGMSPTDAGDSSDGSTTTVHHSGGCSVSKSAEPADQYSIRMILTISLIMFVYYQRKHLLS